MKVMHVEAGRNLYGGALQVFYLLRALQAKHVDNILVCPPQSAIGEASHEVALVESCPINGDLDFKFMGRLKKLIHKHKPDILHIHSRKGVDFWGALVASSTCTPAILTRRVDNREPAFFARFKAKYYKKIVAISEGIRTVLIDEGIAPNHVTTIHSAVDTEKFCPQEKDDAIRQRFGFKSEHTVIAILAQLIERKGHRYLFDAIPAIMEEQPNARFLILGKGPKEQELKGYSKSLGIDPWVNFAGFQNDIDKILQNIDIVVHPALKEGLGVALLQASACAVPIVGAAAGGIPEIVRDGINGYLIPPADSQAISNRILKLINDEHLRNTLGKQGRAIAEDDFSINRMASENYALYQKITTNR